MASPDDTHNVEVPIYATFVELPGDRIVMVGLPGDTQRERWKRLFNCAHVAAACIALEFGDADPVGAREVREVADAAGALVQALGRMREAAQARLAADQGGAS